MAYLTTTLMALFAILLLLQVPGITMTNPTSGWPAHFFDLGTGYSTLPGNDDSFSSSISISTPFVFFAVAQSSLFVCIHLCYYSFKIDKVLDIKNILFQKKNSKKP